MNAYKDGMRSKKRALMRDDAYAFENRKRKWMAKADPADDMGEFLVYQNVCASFEIENAVARMWNGPTGWSRLPTTARSKRPTSWVRELLFDRCGPAGLYGNGPDIRTKHERKLKTSSSGTADDPDRPAKLVAELEKTAQGCIWLRSQWEELRRTSSSPGDSGKAPDRFKAIRLLGCQPADAAVDRTVAQIFIASHAMHRGGKSTFEGLLSDMHEPQLERFQRSVKARWPELFEIDQPEECRQILIDLVDAHIERLNTQIAEFQKVADVTAEQTITNLKCDSTPEGARLRNYILRSRSAFNRGVANFRRHQKACEQADGRERSGDQEPRRTPEPVTDWKDARAAGPAFAREFAAGCADFTPPGPPFARGGNEGGVDLDWAFEAGAALDRGAEPTCGTGAASACDTAAGTLCVCKPLSDLGETLEDKTDAKGQNTTNEAIYERADVKRGGADFVWRAPAHPLRRRLRSIWPISDLSADELVVQPATHPLSPRPRESFLPLCRQCTKR